jgi:hypothetical protein
MPEGKLEFVSWLRNVEMLEEINWLLVGDFNLIRSPENRNKPGGSMQEMSGNPPQGLQIHLDQQTIQSHS